MSWQRGLAARLLIAAALALPVLAPASANAISGSKPWVVVLCNFSNQSATPGTIAEYERTWSGGPTSSLDFVDYWRDVSSGALDVSGTVVKGWNTIPQTRDQWAALSRYDKIRTCAETAASQVDYSKFYGVSAIFPEADGRISALAAGATTMNVTSSRNVPTPPFKMVVDDGSDTEMIRVTAISGATWTIERGVDGTTDRAHDNNAKIIVPGDLGNSGNAAIGITLGGKNYTLALVVGPAHYNMTGIAHETGHGFEYPHSRKLSTSTEDYRDCYDIMSAYSVCSFVGDFGGENLGSVNAAAGPGITGVYLDRQGWLDGSRVTTLSGTCDPRTVTMAPLGLQSTPGLLTVKVPAAVTIATPGGGSTTGEHYWLEYRERLGWDRGLPADGVVLHLRGADGVPYWVDDAGGPNGTLEAGEEYANAAQNTYVAVNSVDTSAHQARLSVSRCKLAPQLQWTGDTSGQYSDSTTLAADLTIGGAPVPGKTVQLTMGSRTCNALTNASGRASCVVTLNDDPGTYTARATYGGSAAYASATAPDTTYTIRRDDSRLVYTGPAEGDYHDPVTLSGRLSDLDSDDGLAGRTVTFTIGATDSCSATTGSDGVASCTLTPEQVPASYSVVSAFAGDTYYEPSGDSDPFTVTKEETATTYTGPTVILDGEPVTLSGRVVEDDGAPVVGRALVLSLGSQSCTGTTGSDGRASCSFTVASALGPQPLAARFAGDDYYLPSEDTDDVAIVFAFPERGAFTIGDRTAADAGTTAPVTWWASDWSSRNVLTGGPAPTAFKGFAAEPADDPPACGRPWSSRAGNSSKPTDGVPSYMGTLVASSVTKSGSRVDGTTLSIVVVRTDDGYAANPGHPGGGTIVATYC